jgi:hypothetical protein
MHCEASARDTDVALRRVQALGSSPSSLVIFLDCTSEAILLTFSLPHDPRS